MLIRIKQHRRLADGKSFGTDIDMTPKDAPKGAPRVSVQFRPIDPKNPEVGHVANVTDKALIARFLAIPEGYEIHESEVAKTAPKQEKQPENSDDDASGNVEAEGAGNATDGAGISRAELIEAVTKATGKKPHPATSVKKLEEMLAEAQP